MFFTKLAIYGTIAGSFFAVSAFSTIQITKQINKTPVPNEVMEEDEEEEIYVRQMSDTEKFINELTGFGNMEGNLNVTLEKGTYSLTLNGDVFVSMESMDDVKVSADLSITTLGKKFDISASYLDGTVYATLEGNNLKLETSSISEITSLFSTMESSIELPETFKNIDTNQLLTNLSSMEAEKSEDKITYTCNLIEGIPPLIFTSDLDYKMTSVSISNFEIEGFKINAYATTKILGKGHNKVVNPETETNPYTNITSYFGVIKQINNLINSKEAGLDYNISLSKGGDKLLSTSGNANVSLKNGLDLVVDGSIKNKDNTKSVTYYAGYSNNNVFMNFNDLVKVYYDVNNFDNLKTSINNLINNPDISKLLANLESVELPIVKMINDKDYNGLIDAYKGLFLSKEQIKLSISNSLFSSNDSNIDIVINLNEEGIKDINIENFRYNDYSLSLSVALKEYKKTEVDLSEYDSVSNIDKVIDQINNLISSKKFNLNIVNLSYGDFTINGYIQIDIVNKLYQADINIRKANVVESVITYTNYRVRFENDDKNVYLIFNDDNSEAKLALSRESIDSTITSIKNLLNNKDSELTKIVDGFINSIKSKIEESSKDINILDILFEDYLKSFDIQKDELNNEIVNISLNGVKLGLESDINLAINLDGKTYISGISGNMLVNNENLEFTLNINDFDANIHVIPLSDRVDNLNEGSSNTGGWVGVSNVTEAVKYVTELDNETITSTIDQIKDIIENKQAGIDYNINVYKNEETGNELVFNMDGNLNLSISDIKDLNSYLVSLSGKLNTCILDQELDGDIDIKLIDSTLYIAYDDIKVAYSIDDIKDLISLIKEKVTNTSLGELIPSTGEINNIPLISIVKEGDYLSLLNYYKNVCRDGNTLSIVLDGALLGGNSDITLSLTTGHNGISNISINGIYALGYSLDLSLDFTTYQEVSLSEEEKASYPHVRYINNIFSKLADLVSSRQAGIDYSISLSKAGNSLLSTSGNANISLKDELDIVIDGSLKNSDESKSITYFGGYRDNNIFVNYNDLIKVSFDVNNFNNLKTSIDNLINNPDIAKLLSNLESIELPVIEMIKNKDYDALLDTYEGLSISDDQISLSISNSLFSDDDSNIDITINIEEENLKDITISNIRYDDYALSLTVALKEYENVEVNLDEYDSISNIDKVINQVNDLVSNKKFNLDIVNLSYGDFVINGNIQIDIVNKIYQADINIQKAHEVDEEITYSSYHMKLDSDDQYFYLSYKDDKNTDEVKAVISRESVDSIISDVTTFLSNKDNELIKLVEYFLDKEINLNTNIDLDNINILDVLFEDYLKSFDISKDEQNNESVAITLNGSKLGLESDINLAIGLDNNTHISSLSGNIPLGEESVEFNVKLNDFDVNYHAIPVNERPETVDNGNENAGGWVGVSDLANVVDYVTNLDNETAEAISTQIKNIAENKEVGISYSINVNKEDELVFGINGNCDLSIDDIKDIDSYLIALSGEMNANILNQNINGNIDIKLIDGTLYLTYDEIKVAYSINDIKDLVSLIKEKVINSSDQDINNALNKLLPSQNDLNDIPLIDIISSKNYISLINYYKGCIKDDNGTLSVILDGSLLGGNSDITLSLTSGNTGISNISINGLNAFGYTIDISLDLADYQEVSMTDEEKDSYPNIRYINNIFSEIMDVVNSKEIGLDYAISLSKDDNELLSTSGNANISLNDELDIVVDGLLKNADESKSASYFGGYRDNNVFVNFNDLIKVYYDVNNFDNLKSSIDSLINNPDIAKLLTNLESIELPIIEMINEKDYDGLINAYEGLSISDDQIKLSISNSLLGDNDSNIDITINIEEESLKDITINNVRYNGYALSLTVILKDYQDVEVDLDEYDSISNIDKVIDQINDLISSKKFNLDIVNLSYGDFVVNGNAQIDIDNKIYQADVNIQKATETDNGVTYSNYRIRFENDDDNFYLIFNDGTSEAKLALSKESIESTIASVKNLLNNKDAELTKIVDEFVDDIKNKIAESSENINVLDILFEDYLKSFDIVQDEVNNTEVVNISLNGVKLGLESDINLAFNLDEATKISGIAGNLDIKGENAEFDVKLHDFDPNLHVIPLSDRVDNLSEGNSNIGGWVGVSNVTEAVKYVTELDNETITSTIDQIKDIIENKQAGIDYNINVYKNEETGNELVFNIAGDVDLDLNDLTDLESLKVNFSGNMTNTNVGKELDSDISIKLYDGVVYFDYNNQLKFAYSIDDIKGLISIIKDKIQGNSTSDISGVLDKLFPSSGDTTSSPIVNIIKEGNYLSLINYYKNAYKDENGTLSIVLDGALIGNDGSDIIISLTTGHNGISNISINGIYALGYTLDCSFDIRNYVDFEMSEDEINGYTNLRYINNMFDQVYELVHEKEFKLTLNGSVNLGKGNLSINGTSYVALGEESDIGIANLTIQDTNGKSHNIKLDVNRVKTGDNALSASQVAFIYNNNLKGYLNLQSLTDTFNLIKELSDNDNPLFDKIKVLFTRDSTQSTLNKVMNGEPEAILYDNTLDSITHGSNLDGSHYYDIQVNGNLFKKDSEQEADPINILINMDEDNKFTGLTLRGSISGYSLDITVGIDKEESNPSSWDRINITNKFYNFSDIKTLAEYLFETGTKKNFSLSGTISANVIDIFNVANISMNAKVHIDEDNNTIAMIEIDNIPQISYLLGAIKISDDDWDYRKATIYLTDEEVYIYVYYYDDYTSWFKKYRKTTTKYVKLSMSEFANDAAYYLVNYSLGVTTGSIAGQSLDMRNTASSSDKDIDFSKILSSYSYANNGTPTWSVGINLAELAGSNMLDTLNATITGNSQTKLLSTVNATTKLAGIVNASINASLNSTDYIGDTAINNINSYLEAHQSDTNKQSYSSTNTVKK